MTYADAQRARSILQDLAERRDRDTFDWIALAEDTLRHFLPADSQLLARFTTVKAQAYSETKESLTTLPAELSMKIERECKGVVRAASDLITTLSTEAAPPVNLELEIERVIQKGYFKSWPFRLVIGGLLLLAVLITGVATFKIDKQVEAMQKLVDDARNQVNAGREQVTQAKSEIANMHAQLSTLVLQGSEDLLTMRVKAIGALEDSRRNYLKELEARQQQMLSDLDEVGKKDTRKVDERTKASLEEFGGIESQYKDRVRDKVQSVIQDLEASKRPWVPVVVWSIAKSWLILPLTLVISLLAWINSAVRMWRHEAFWAKVAVVVNAVLLTAIVVFIYVRA